MTDLTDGQIVGAALFVFTPLVLLLLVSVERWAEALAVARRERQRANTRAAERDAIRRDEARLRAASRLAGAHDRELAWRGVQELRRAADRLAAGSSLSWAPEGRDEDDDGRR